MAETLSGSVRQQTRSRTRATAGRRPAPCLLARATVLALALALAATAALVAACGGGARTLALHGEAMGTRFSIVAVAVPPQLDEATLRGAIDATLARLDARLSNWNPASEISRFNATRHTGPVPMSADLAAVMAEARRVHAASGGRFDVTLGPLLDLWGFGAGAVRDPAVPAAAQIARARALVGQHRLLAFGEDPPSMAKRHPDVTISLAALAKGYGIDALADTLRELGLAHFLVEIGGDLYASGHF